MFKIIDTNFFIADYIFVGLLLIVANYSRFSEPVSPDKTFQLLEDLPDSINSSNDKLLRSEYAIHVAKVINATVPKKAVAVAISIIAEWGYGKTTFLNYIEKNLDNNTNSELV